MIMTRMITMRTLTMTVSQTMTRFMFISLILLLLTVTVTVTGFPIMTRYINTRPHQSKLIPMMTAQAINGRSTTISLPIKKMKATVT